MERDFMPLERLLARLWSNVLNRDVGNRSADFFALGGRPEQAEQLLVLLEERLGVAVPMETLTETRTLGAFSSAIKRQVDHPRRLERMAERLLESDTRPRTAAAVGR
jgi:hypothetical protein